MARLIDIDNVFPNRCFYVNGSDPMTSLDELISRIHNAPAVDVVFCKECKHWADGVAGCTDHVKCCKVGFYMVGENGYCVYGERRGQDGN